MLTSNGVKFKRPSCTGSGRPHSGALVSSVVFHTKLWSWLPFQRFLRNLRGALTNFGSQSMVSEHATTMRERPNQIGGIRSSERKL